MKNKITVSFFGYSPETGKFSCAVYKGNPQENNGKFIESFTEKSLTFKTNKAINELTKGQKVFLKSTKKWETILEIL